MPIALDSLPPLSEQIRRLVRLGVHELLGLSTVELRAAMPEGPEGDNSLLVVSPQALAPSVLAPLLEHRGKSGFVVTDMVDVDQFASIPEAAAPDALFYLVHGLDRGDDLANWSPNEALPEIVARDRSPLTLTEGVHWLLQAPQVLTRNHCFMTVGSRLRKADGTLDARTPALWISNGTGRDGVHNRNAPKVGWCWAGNRHTWLGIASCSSRTPLVA